MHELDQLGEFSDALRLKDVMRVTGLARATIYKHMKSGKFPPGFSRSDIRMITWNASDILAWKRGEWRPQ